MRMVYDLFHYQCIAFALSDNAKEDTFYSFDSQRDFLFVVVKKLATLNTKIIQNIETLI